MHTQTHSHTHSIGTSLPTSRSHAAGVLVYGVVIPTFVVLKFANSNSESRRRREPEPGRFPLFHPRVGDARSVAPWLYWQPLVLSPVSRAFLVNTAHFDLHCAFQNCRGTHQQQVLQQRRPHLATSVPSNCQTVFRQKRHLHTLLAVAPDVWSIYARSGSIVHLPTLSDTLPPCQTFCHVRGGAGNHH